MGSEVVQLYVSLPPTSGLTHPPLQLKAFAKVYDLQPGQSQDVHMILDKYAVSYWAEEVEAWIVEQGEYGLRAGTSSASLEAQAGFTIAKGFEWRGI
jgi:beta-glucosidase